MSKTLLILLFATLCCFHAWPQTTLPVRVKGRITDKDTQQPLADATVTLLYAKDSLRATTAFTDKNGAFSLAAKPGAYYLYISYIGYQQSLKAIMLATDTLRDIGIIPVQKTGVNLRMVEIVEIRAPMAVKKDTLEFNADSYKTMENALMEALLKKLPGIEIGKDGSVKFNGEPIKRILVDGKPFFGDDPKLAIRNLPADLIDKIQLVDQKTDQAQFSGANDGKTEKTVNITTKKEKKNTFSGRASAGYGTDKRYSLNGSLNRFGAHPLSFLGSGNNMNGTQESGMGIGGSGAIRNWNGGVNYNTDMGKQLKASGSYYIDDINTVNEQSSTRQNLLPDTTYYYNQHTNATTNKTNHRSDVRLEYNPDTMHTIILNTNLYYAIDNDHLENSYESLGDQKQLVNSGTILNAGNNSSKGIMTNFLWGKRFKKTSRTLSINIGMAYNDGRQQQLNQSYNLFIQPNGESFRDTIDQRSSTRNHRNSIALNITYTEPLYKDHFLDVVYMYNRDGASSEKLTYDFNTAKGTYDLLNDSLSNAFRNIAELQQGSISFRVQKHKYDYSIGVQMQLSSLYNKNISAHSYLQKSTSGFFPVVVFNFAFNNNHRIKARYNGRISQPDISLLQPVPDNSNPLYVQLGNPDIKPAVVHHATMSYNAFNPAAFHNTMISLSANVIRNKIITATWMDSLGKQVSQPINANGTYYLGALMSHSFPFTQKKINATILTMTSLARDINQTNGQAGYADNLFAEQDISFNYTYQQLWDCALKTGIEYYGYRYSQQKERNIDVYNYVLSFNGNILLPRGLSIGGNIDYQLNTGVRAGYKQQVTMVNAFIAKSAFRRKQGLIKLQGFDLLNNNQGYSRDFGINYVAETNTNVLARFFLLSFTYFLKP